MICVEKLALWIVRHERNGVGINDPAHSVHAAHAHGGSLVFWQHCWQACPVAFVVAIAWKSL